MVIHGCCPGYQPFESLRSLSSVVLPTRWLKRQVGIER